MPNPDHIESKALIALAKKCYKETDAKKQIIIENEIDEIVWLVFNVA